MAPKIKGILLASICLNAVLAAAWIVSRSATPAEPNTISTNGDPVLVSSSKKKAGNRSVQTITVSRDKNLDWSNIESPDYREYIKNLRATGCPEETVRDIIIADINKLYAGKMAALYPAPKDIKFWRVEDRVARNEERERDKKRDELNKEKRALIKELLGVDYDSELAKLSGRPSDDDLRYGFLSPEKQQQAKDLREKYREMERSLFTDGGMTPENRAKFTALRAQRETEMAQLLGPAEYEQYQLHSSYTARNMRENLTSFQPSEDEFKQIFQAQKVFDDQYALGRTGGDSANADERKAAQQKLDEQLKSVLGDQRYTEYKMSQDERYRDAYNFAQKNNLPPETAATVYQVRVAAEQEKQRIQSDPNLSADARAAALQGIANDTKNVLGQTLGPDTMASYLPRSGSWINQMSQTDAASRDRRNRFDRGDRGDRGRRNGTR